MVWYAGNYPQVRLSHLEERMRQSGNYTESAPLTLEKLHNLLFTAVESADIDMLKADVLPFIKDPRELELWSKDFFREIVPLFSGEGQIDKKLADFAEKQRPFLDS